MTTNELVSVIIPAYNHEKYVQEAIQSVIDQSYPHIELIVIDDGSNDGTWAKINGMKEQCEKRFVKTIFETQDNQGTCLTLNRLLSLSSGEYVQLLASDDKLSPKSTQILYDFLSVHLEYALVTGKNEIIDSKSRICYWDNALNIVYNKSEAKYLSFTDLLSERVDLESEQFGSYSALLKSNHIPNGYLIRKNVFNQIGLFTPKAPLEDYWLMLQLSKITKLKYFNETTFYYRWHGGNTVSQTNKIEKMTLKTLQHEMDIVHTSNIKSVIHIFNDTFKNRIYFSIPFFIKLYRIKNPKQKLLVLEIFSYKINLKKVLYN